MTSILLKSAHVTGLDARAALLVVNALRKMADQGRTIVATFDSSHQPSSTVTVFVCSMTCYQVLKKGGEVMCHGELGVCSSTYPETFKFDSYKLH